MKVQVNIQVAAGIEASSRLDLIVGVTDTVLSIKDRVALIQPLPFPDQDLMLDGEVLADDRVLSECGIKDQLSLDLVVRAAEATLVKQLSDLLQARDLSCDELGLLYCYKHGVSVGQALRAVGHGDKLQDFMKKHKDFQLENGRVTLVREGCGLKPFSVSMELVQILQASETGVMEIKDLCAKFLQKFNMSVSSLVGMKPADFVAQEKDVFTIAGRGLVSLRSSQEKVARFPVSTQQEVSKPTPAVEVDLRPDSGSDAPSSTATEIEETSAESQQYVDLHSKISSRPFNSKVSVALTDIVDAVSEALFLNVDHVAKGGSIGKGTSIMGAADAEVVFFLKGLPPCSHERWLPPLLRAAAGALSENLEGRFDEIRVADDSVQVSLKGGLMVDIRFSHTFENYAKTIQALGEQGPDARRFFSPALVKERVQFIAKQPSQVKMTIRLLKWWRDQQDWSSKLVRPTDEILELVAVYSAVQEKPADQRQAITNAMSLMSRFDSLRITWCNFYARADVWAPLLRQRPLLMDPVNPFVNIADPQYFDPRELMNLARTTHFFW